MRTLSGQRVTVMGLGHFGGGSSVVNFLLEQGAQVTLTDLASEERLSKSLDLIPRDRLTELVLGQHREQDFTNADLVIVSPAVKPDNEFVAAAKGAGVPCSSEIELFLERCIGKVIAVTGSVGKSTTAALIEKCLKTAGHKAVLGGNIGHSLLSQLSEIDAETWVVLELSSFQLAALEDCRPAPQISVVTNFFENHIDWHQSLDHYRESKQNICAWQRADQFTVMNADNHDLALWPTDAKVIWFGKECWTDRPGVVVKDDHLIVRTATTGWKIEQSDLSPALASAQGLMAVAAALAVVTVIIDVPVEQLAGVLSTFEALPHRLQPVGESGGRHFINDSKATTPESTIAALRHVPQPIVLIAGGKDKGVSLAELAEEIQASARAVALVGETAEELRRLIEDAFRQSMAKEKRSRSAQAELDVSWIFVAKNFDEAFKWAWEQSESGDTILLSPACASHAEFANYERRGERFTDLIQQLPH